MQAWGLGMNTSDEVLRQILQSTQVIALVGASMNPQRASHSVGQYLSQLGKRVIPINPGHAGKELFGEVVRASLFDIPDDIQVDMVDIFRRSDQVLPVVEDALTALPHLQTVWMQLDIENAKGRAIAEARGIVVVENRCPKIEYHRLFGDLPQG
jgi:predicted CoA-binding protein